MRRYCTTVADDGKPREMAMIDSPHQRGPERHT
jgi:hypothetical protein